MPNITISITQAQADRIKAALKERYKDELAAGWPPDKVFTTHILRLLQGLVLDFEQEDAERAARQILNKEF